MQPLAVKPVLLNVADLKLRVTPEEFARLCQLNRDLRLELTKDGELIVMPPTGGETGKRNINIAADVVNIYPIDRIGQIAHKHQIPRLCDAAQAVGKIDIDFSKGGITFLAISGHKLYAPKGIGALVIREGTQLQPQIFGGGNLQLLAHQP